MQRGHFTVLRLHFLLASSPQGLLMESKILHASWIVDAGIVLRSGTELYISVQNFTVVFEIKKKLIFKGEVSLSRFTSLLDKVKIALCSVYLLPFGRYREVM